MKEYLKQIDEWRKSKKRIVMARVIQTWGSSPRPVGSVMLISSSLEMAGSVSGGCIEGAVVRQAKEIFEAGKAQRLDFGVSDEDAWAVGLSCGGKIQVYMQLMEEDEALTELQVKLSRNEGCVLVTTLNSVLPENTLIDEEGAITGRDLISSTRLLAKEVYEARAHRSVQLDEHEYFLQVFPPRSKLIIIGAAHITSDLVQLGKSFDFETIVVDPRGTFARNTSFPVPPDQIHEKYPSAILNDFKLDPYTYAVILSHDPKIDDDALRILLKTPVAYIGALGSKKNHEKRKVRLLEHGFSTVEIDRIDAPIGIDIHAKGAREIALSIMGAVIKAKNEHV